MQRDVWLTESKLNTLFGCRRQLIELILGNPAVIVGVHFGEMSFNGVLVLRSGGGDEFGVIDRAVMVLVASCEAGRCRFCSGVLR